MSLIEFVCVRNKLFRSDDALLFNEITWISVIIAH